MAARTNSVKPDDFSEATVEMIREMVRRAEVKLSSLQARRTHIRRRIQALHHLCRTVAAEVAVSAVEDFVLSETELPAKEPVLDPFAKRTSTAPDLQSLQQSETTALRRACRIALMETDGAESCVQILQRISRRQSVLFRSHNDPVEEVASELARMAAEGEAVVFLMDDAQHWQLRRSMTATDTHPAQRSL